MKTVRISLAAIVVCLLFRLTLSAQSQYNVSLIDPENTKNSKAVIRLLEHNLMINSRSSATLRVKKAVTILNETGRWESVYFGVNDKFTNYHFTNLVIFNKDGEKVKSFGTMDLLPVVTFSGSTLYSDVIFRTLDPDYRTYPFTAEITYSIDLKGYFSLPAWIIAEDYNISTEKAVLNVIAPADYNLRFFEQNLPVGVVKKTENGKVLFDWKIENFNALEKEPFFPDLERMTPAVFLAPGNFEIAGWKGSSFTWQDYGRFIADLNTGRNTLPDNMIARIREIASENQDTVEIIRTIYSLLQEKTRYVSVQIGIGGWQPIEAKKVDETSYGDCKALSNYMKAMLDVVGIRSYYTLINAGAEAPQLLRSFPSNQFNHAIICVPRKPDTIWLECTSQRIPFDYLGSFTDDRDALLITEEGGIIARTSRYKAEENCITRKASVTIDASGNGKASVITKYSSFFYDRMMPVFLSDLEDQKRWVSESVSIPGNTLEKFTINQPDKSHPVIIETLELSLKGYASVLSDRIILPLNLMNRSSRIPVSSETRVSEILLRRETTQIDTIIFRIPQGYYVLSSTNPVSIESPFGQYRTSVEIIDDKRLYSLVCVVFIVVYGICFLVCPYICVFFFFELS